MQIRKEQGLFLVVLALGAWAWTSMKPTPISSRVSVSYAEYEAGEAPAHPLVEAAAAAPRRPGERDPFVEPSETAPLGPRPLPFPPRRTLPLVAPPLDPGPAPPAYRLLRVDGAPATQVALGPGTEGEGDPSSTPLLGEGGAGEGLNGGAGGGDGDDDTYDTVVLVSTGLPLKGYVRNANKYELHGATQFREPVRFDRVSINTGQIMRSETFEPEEVQLVELADTLRNRLEVRRRDLGDGEASQVRRREYLLDALRIARQHAWVYAIAADEVERYVEISGGSVEAYRLKARVLRERGALSELLAMYQGLSGELEGSALQLAGLAEVEVALGLDVAALEHLGQAAAAQPSDPLVRAAHARALLTAGDVEAALEEADAAWRNRTTLTDDEQLLQVCASVIAVQLARGDLSAARNALTRVPRGEAVRARRDLLKGAIAYTAGEFDEAEKAYAGAVQDLAVGDRAALGQALCRVLDGRWRAAEASLRAVVESAPLQRHVALAGLGLLYLRTANPQLAVTELEAAVEAAPHDAHAQYLLGCARRRLGDSSGALDALAAALAESDDFVEALAETAETYLGMVESNAGAAALIVRAQRYIDRAVVLEAQRGEVDLALLELQGAIRFRADPISATQPFKAGDERGSEFCSVGLALVEYARNRVVEAANRFTDLVTRTRSGDPLRAYAEEVLELINDHNQKEQLRDAFEREVLGDRWDVDKQPGFLPMLSDGRLRLAGQQPSGSQPIVARRSQPVAGNFLAAEVVIHRRPGDASRFAGLQISTLSRRGGAGPDFRARLGFSEGQPFLLIEDGRPDNADEDERALWDPVELEELPFDQSAPQALALSVYPQPDDDQRFVLRAEWNGVVLHERGIEKLRRSTRLEMPIELLAYANAGNRVDVEFDDFRLVRRKEQR